MKSAPRVGGGDFLGIYSNILYTMNYEFKPPKYSEIGKSLWYKWTMNINLLIDTRWLTLSENIFFVSSKTLLWSLQRFQFISNSHFRSHEVLCSYKQNRCLKFRSLIEVSFLKAALQFNYCYNSACTRFLASFISRL